jgi:pimeloyl-ACP methyl ester carboxylesterase
MANGIRMHYVEMGSGPLVLLLHGFPELWYAWRFVLPRLAAAGFRAVAPDLRGYNLTDRPSGTRSYTLDVLSADVAGLVRALGEESATVVGHDWGAVVAFGAAHRHPDAVRRLVIANGPHPAAMRRELRHLDQARRSWYAAFFQLPLVPEAVLSAGNHALLRRVLRNGPRRKGAVTDEDERVYVDAWSRPGALTAMLAYYRAFRLPGGSTGRVDQPTLVVWGDRDEHLRASMADHMAGWVPNVHVRHLPDASHWVPADEPELLSTLIADFAA